MPCLVKSVYFSDRMFLYPSQLAVTILIMKTVRDFAALRSGPASFNRRKQANKYYKNNWKKKKKKYERKKGNATRRRSNKTISLIESQLNKIISASKGAQKVMLWKVILFLSSSSFSAWSGTNVYMYIFILWNPVNSTTIGPWKKFLLASTRPYW